MSVNINNCKSDEPFKMMNELKKSGIYAILCMKTHNDIRLIDVSESENKMINTCSKELAIAVYYINEAKNGIC